MNIPSKMIYKIVEYAKDVSLMHNCQLTFLTIMGSHLYGNSTETSDIDVKGIMVPSKSSCLLNNAPRNINIKEGNNDLGIDFELYSIQEYFKLLRSGETVSCDMLFAQSYPDAILYLHPKFVELYEENIDKVIAGDRLDKNPYLRYAYSQAIKYGVKGNRYEIIQKVLNLAQIYYETDFAECKRLGDYLDELESAGGNRKYCFKTNIEASGKKLIPGLYLAGKTHQGTITLGEFVKRCNVLISEYGERARLAANNGGNDWKALSHAFRAVCQLNELVKTGNITFPRLEAKFLQDIKQGKIAFEVLKESIENNFKFFDEIVKESTVTKTYRFNQKFVDKFILSFYEEE
jgi:hypothetical protein